MKKYTMNDFTKKDTPAVFLFFLTMSVFMFKEVLLKGCADNNLVTGDAYAHMHIPLQLVEQCSFLWNPYFFCGFPLFADMNFTLLSPFSIVRILLQRILPCPSISVFNFIYILYFPLAAFFMYLYSRKIGIGRAGAVIGGVIFGIIRDYKIPLPLHSYIFLPLIFLMFEKAISAKKIDWMYIIFTGFFYGIQFAGAHIQYSYLFTLFFIVYGGFRWSCRLRQSDFKYKESKQYFFAFLLIFIIATGIFAIQFFPTYELAKHSARFYLKDINIAYGQGYLTIKAIKGLWLFDIHTIKIFIGIIPLCLAVLPLFFRINNKFYYFYLLTSAGFLIMSSRCFITRFLYYNLPCFSFLRCPGRAALFFVFSSSILVGLGLDRIKYKALKIILVALVLVSIFNAWRIFHRAEFLSLYKEYSNPDCPENFIERSPEYLSINKFLTEIKDETKYEYRVFLNADEKALYLLDKNLYFLSGQSDLIFSRYLEFTKTSEKDIDRLKEDTYLKFLLYPNYLKLTSTKYIILDKTLEGEELEFIKKVMTYYHENGLFEKIYEDDLIKGYLFKNVLPRALFVNNMLYIQDKQEILDILKNPAFFPDKTVILEEPVVSTGNFFNGNLAAGDVRMITYFPTKVEIKIRANSPGFVVLLDSYYPGWKAYIDNTPAKIYRANYLFRAVYLDKPGFYKIKFIYSPLSFKLGLTITIITLFACMGGLVWIQRTKRQYKSSAAKKQNLNKKR